VVAWSRQLACFSHTGALAGVLRLLSQPHETVVVAGAPQSMQTSGGQQLSHRGNGRVE